MNEDDESQEFLYTIIPTSIYKKELKKYKKQPKKFDKIREDSTNLNGKRK
jgi:hypothetical protein